MTLILLPGSRLLVTITPATRHITGMIQAQQDALIHVFLRLTGLKANRICIQQVLWILMKETKAIIPILMIKHWQ
ncbi:MAG: hypothetical protein CVU88_06245 [Firmicutes bacterium HGW-Firmicutes-13]|nr:MAG: hypothetical protein CVU88_06245 [Firmicutes bacterium HGW-Firmicutes-13]